MPVHLPINWTLDSGRWNTVGIVCQVQEGAP